MRFFSRHALAYLIAVSVFFAANAIWSAAFAQSIFELFGEREAAFAVVDGAGKEIATFNGGMAEEPLPPFSTFKIWNSLIALETGAMKDTRERLDYDPVKYPLPYMGYPDIPAWKQPHDMGSAFKASAVWYYREMAGRIGPERMQDWLDRISYGNRDISGGLKDGKLDDFWNGFSLRISALQQVELLAKLLRGELPFSAQAIASLREMALIESCDGRALYGKTGAGTWEDSKLGWLLGWTERGDERRIFALVLTAETFEPMIKERLPLAKQALEVVNAWEACRATR